MSNDPKDFALAYAGKGIRTFPVQPGGKAPCHRLIDSWPNEATTDADQIREWWDEVPNANVGLATGEWDRDGTVWAVDIDVKNGKNGRDEWNALRAEHEDDPVPTTTSWRTPSGGSHLLLVAPGNLQIKSAEDNIAPGVDSKGNGGYVVAPPSETDSGAYELFDGFKGIAPAPGWLLQRAYKPRSTEEREPVPAGDPHGAPDDELIEEALNAVPPNPSYDRWFRIIAAVKDGASSDRVAARMLERWSPENRNGKYTYEERVNNAANDRITVATLFGIAQDHGWTHPANRAEVNTANGNPAGDGRPGAEPQHPDEWYEQTPNGTEEDKDDSPSLDDLDIESLPALLDSDIRPPEPLVTYDGRSLLHEGTSQLVAKPKIGKTNLAMNLGLAIASEDGVALGNAEVQRHGRVLMLNLDGSKRGAYDRFQTMTEGSDVPERFDVLHGQFPEVDPDGEGGAIDLLREYDARHDGETELIIVDTLQHLRPTSDGRRNVYHEDYDFVHPIAQFGRDTDTSILLVHHLNKLENGDELDKVSGSTGLTGAVENVMILDRARGETKATLSVRPREDREEDFTLEFDGHVLTWCVGESGYEPTSTARRKIWNALRDADNPMEVSELATMLGKSNNAVSKTIGRMIENDAPVTKTDRGTYKAVSGAS